MAKSKSTSKSSSQGKSRTAIDRAAQAVGRTLGTVARNVDALQARHPHPVKETRKALVSGRKTLAAVAAATGERATAVVTEAGAVLRRTKKAAWQARAKPTPVARAKRAAKTAVSRAKKAVTRGQKAVTLAAKRLKR
ncbi:MAG: hypothetical protein ABL961_17385 [Vicinamibacterales bacterium]